MRYAAPASSGSFQFWTPSQPGLTAASWSRRSPPRNADQRHSAGECGRGLFWVVWDAEKAALEVEDYRAAIAWAAQTALRDIIGRMMLADILVGRSAIDEELQRIIDERTTPGV